MKKMKVTILVFSLLLLGCNNAQQNRSDRQAEQRINESSSVNTANQTLESTVSITMQDNNRQTLALGSGTIVGSGLVITNLHVIAGATNGFIQMSNDDQKHNIAGLFAIDESNDLALLSIPTLQAKSLKIQINLPKIGEKIFAAGNPHGLSGTFSDGIVSSLRNFNNRELIQITAPISPGSSGGPIVNENAELLGIAVGGFDDGQNLNFIIPSKAVANLLQNKRDLFSLKIPQFKKASSAKGIETDLVDKVVIRNLQWGKTIEVSADSERECRFLTDFSILNNLDKPIYNVKVFFIMYDNKNIPVDYEICKFATSQNAILPNLGKTFETGTVNGCRNLMKYAGYHMEIRILDFDILN